MQTTHLENIPQKLQQLLDQDEWSEHDRQWLLQVLETEDGQALKEVMQQRFGRHTPSASLHTAEAREMLQQIHRRIGHEPAAKPPVVRLWKRMAAAAVIILVAASIYMGLHRGDRRVLATTRPSPVQPAGRHAPGMLPGTNKAVLTLANGSAILLDDAHNGALAQQGHTRVLKFNGRLSYKAPAAGTNETLYNTITTPRGGQYQIQLPDGSEVWLNAASSIRFPTAFTGPERQVEISGEAYFEVAKNPARPFVVKIGGSEVRVLGTHFNIMAYREEDVMKTTLLEGSVLFTHGTTSTMLKPGQQSRLLGNGQLRTASGIDVNDELAWKNGLFHFEGVSIEQVMRQLSRWYDVDIEYRNGKNDELFYAEIPRNTLLPDVLKALELTGKVRLATEGRKIIVNR